MNNFKICYSIKLKNIYLENNSIARIPLFNDCRIDNLIDKSCKIDNSYNDLQFSNLELEPTIAQQFIIQNFLDTEAKISIYNNNMIEIINSSTIFVGSSNITEITESDLSEQVKVTIIYFNRLREIIVCYLIIFIQKS